MSDERRHAPRENQPEEQPPLFAPGEPPDTSPAPRVIQSKLKCSGKVFATLRVTDDGGISLDYVSPFVRLILLERRRLSAQRSRTTLH